MVCKYFISPAYKGLHGAIAPQTALPLSKSDHKPGALSLCDAALAAKTVSQNFSYAALISTLSAKLQCVAAKITPAKQ